MNQGLIEDLHLWWRAGSHQAKNISRLLNAPNGATLDRIGYNMETVILDLSIGTLQLYFYSHLLDVLNKTSPAYTFSI